MIGPGRRRRSWTDRELLDVGEAQDDQAHAQGHDQRVDLEDADADAVDEARERGGDEGRGRWRTAGPGLVDWRRR